ncbi:hypothetical protein ACOSQ4_009667 [Xanthoceras sorbifolium]
MRKLKNDALEMVLDTHSHDITNRVVPYYNRWSSQYGETFMCWHGIEPKIFISDLELVKQVLLNKFSFYTKPVITPLTRTLFGNGLGFLTGQDWIRHNKIINPAFNIDKLKIFTSEDQCKTMEMKGEFKRLSADILRTNVLIFYFYFSKWTKLDKYHLLGEHLVREASKDVKLGKITIPKGTGIIIPSIKIHRSKKYWEEDAEDSKKPTCSACHWIRSKTLLRSDIGNASSENCYGIDPSKVFLFTLT